MEQDISLIRLNHVMKRTGHSRSAIYAAMSRGEFPQSVKIGPRSVAWLESEIDEYIAGCIAVSRAQA